MKNFKKYLVLALSFGLGLNLLNANPKTDFTRALKIKNEQAAIDAMMQLKTIYQEHSLASFYTDFKEAFHKTFEEAQANKLGLGRDQLMAERDEALEKIRQSREQRKETGKKIRAKITAEREKNQRLQATMEELQAAQEEIRGLRRALENGGNNNDVAQLLQEQDDRNRRVADIATQNILLMREDLQQEQDARTAAEEALEDARRETANKDDEISNLQEQIEALQGQINRLQNGSTTTGNANCDECETRVTRLTSLLRQRNSEYSRMMKDYTQEIEESKKKIVALTEALDAE